MLADTGSKANGEPAAASNKTRTYIGNVVDDIGLPVVADLEALDEELSALEQETKAEELALKRRYEEEWAKLLAERQRVLTRMKGAADSKAGTPAIPGFWRTVLQNSPLFAEDVQRHDEPVLDFLSDIQSSYIDDNDPFKGFKILFLFSLNPYFSNRVLEKTYLTESKAYMRPQFVKISATRIDWLPGKNVTVDVVVSKKAKHARRRPAKPRREEVPRPSFFRTFFRNLGPDEEIPDDESESDLEDGELMNALIDEDLEQGMGLRDSVVPHAVRWFTGEACSEDESGDGETGESEEGEEDEEEPLEEDEEELEVLPAAGGAEPADRRGAQNLHCG
eukprot:TRINITY_DN11276_c0_g2_i1.p1 TRINITY_DN11276_c0_g2~~TRINITY_DN11276_c0_g2_i1.p1  ORF type:complete len:335 (-),score=104.45 TRINITY_DN11276_c0_g2_i1:448-1452(-)